MILFPILLRFNDLSIERELSDFDSNITKLYQFSSVQSLSHVQLFATPWTAARQASLELAQTHVHPAGDAIQPSYPLLSPSPPAFNLSQHQGLLK